MTDCACGGTVDEVSECKHKMILSNLPSDAKIRKTNLIDKKGACLYNYGKCAKNMILCK